MTTVTTPSSLALVPSLETAWQVSMAVLPLSEAKSASMNRRVFLFVIRSSLGTRARGSHKVPINGRCWDT
jgi:hypothetical protein